MMQRDIIEGALRDMRVLGFPTNVPVHIDVSGEHTKGQCIGACYLVDRVPTSIWVSPDLRNGRLHRVVLHEIGHVFGLNHTRNRGIMHACPGGTGKVPTRRQRRAWATELAILVITHRKQEI